MKKMKLFKIFDRTKNGDIILRLTWYELSFPLMEQIADRDRYRFLFIDKDLSKKSLFLF